MLCSTGATLSKSNLEIIQRGEVSNGFPFLFKKFSLALALLNDNLLSAPRLDKTSPLIGSVIDLLMPTARQLLNTIDLEIV